MSPIVILSSPPKTFARSVTPVDASSPLPSPGTLFGSQAAQQTPRKFKTANVQRDGFSGFSIARSLLGVKVGAENVPVRVPSVGKGGLKALSPKRFKSIAAAVQVKDVDLTHIAFDKDDSTHGEDTEQGKNMALKPSASLAVPKRINTAPTGVVSTKLNTPKSQIKLGACRETPSRPQDDPFELPSSSQPLSEQPAFQERPTGVPRVTRPFSPLNIDTAISRKIDWTPTKDAAEVAEDPSPTIALSRSFSGGLLGSFGYNGDTVVVTPANCHEIDTAPTKRRRIDMIVTNISSNVPPSRATGLKKAKAAPRKALTITGLATSNYIGKDTEERWHSALDQILTTQARALKADHDDSTSKVAQAKVVKRQRASKKNAKKSTLVSPASAIKALENQDAMFGSASQLARDESPSLMLDALEALRQSESYSFSSPLRTQDTEPISIGSTTPRADTGVARFTKKRGLWAAAGRDEDNALLHVDTVDIDVFDTPDLRHAFTGKDVLVQPSASRARESKFRGKESPSLRVASLLQSYTEDVWDIDNMDTPVGPIRVVNLPKMQVRTLHTTDRVKSPRKRASPAAALEVLRMDEPQPTNGNAGPQPKKLVKRTPKKPAFAGLTTEKLQKQIAAYGFKQMKKREHMIEVLEKCWDAKHVAAEQVPAVQAEPIIDEAHDSMKHGEYLSNVHGLANRLVPKEKRAPKPKKPKEPKEPKEPKPRKKHEQKAVKDENPKAPKFDPKRKSKAALSEEKVVDIDDVGDAGEAAATAAADNAVENATTKKMTATTKSDTPTKATSKAKAKRQATPPAGFQAPASSPAFVTPIPLPKETTISTITPSFDTTIDAQIELAITSHQAPVSTNHQRDPTWHEKILMYDPIVLEELAAWLNTEGLGKIGEDREVSALEVRQFCEQRGICCLWRGGWRGNQAVKE